MKKIFVLSAFAFAFAINANAQCNTCGANQQNTQPVFTPQVFTPSPVGVEARGIAYLEYAPTGGSHLHATVYLYTYGVDANGNKIITGVTTKGVVGFIAHRPGYWPDEFELPGSFDPATRKYYQPKPVAMIYKAVNIIDGNGNPAVEEKVSFYF